MLKGNIRETAAEQVERLKRQSTRLILLNKLIKDADSIATYDNFKSHLQELRERESEE